MEGGEAQMIYKTDPAHLELVHLGPYYGPDVGPVHAHDTALGLFPLVAKDVLLGEHFFGRGPLEKIRF